MRERPRATINELRQAVQCLPRHTRIAMLEGIRSNEIIVGAYTNGSGICPMLAAHRAGGRTDFIGFAKAWDRFAFRDARRQAARRATARELLILKTHLEATLLEDDGPGPDLRAAMAEHRELMARRAEPARVEHTADRSPSAEPRSPRDGERRPECRPRPATAWMRIVRRHDDYQRSLARLEAAERHHDTAGRREHELV